eukprot:Pompholyxophrys_sp_v1_NODE_564_length_460_cov_8.165432.p2 type:complete len:106 gc:universal NODE_564_length_460_cov_8.165432:325-8(-)
MTSILELLFWETVIEEGFRGYVEEEETMPERAPAVRRSAVFSSFLPLNSKIAFLALSKAANCTAEYGTMRTTLVPLPLKYPLKPSSMYIFRKAWLMEVYCPEVGH